MKTKVLNILAMVILAAAGLFFLLYPSKSLEVVVLLLGVALIILGLVLAISYLVKKDKVQKDLVSLIAGTVMVLLGVFDIIFRKSVVDIFPTVAGIVVAAGGIAGIVQSLRSKNAKKDWKLLLAVSLTTIAMGIIMFIRKFDEEAILRVMGTALLYLGAVGIVNHLDDADTKKDQTGSSSYGDMLNQ
ncbi:MAG: DUF308 domain-containing protein [Lachnospiraceae bacterium]|nr:DUF308 domain-containing protein [Lachnospiraceae bacterium]